MKKSFIAVLLIAALALTLCLSACGGNKTAETQKATEAAAQTEAETEEQLLPLTNNTAVQYMLNQTGVNPEEIADITMGAEEGGTFFVMFTKDGKYYYYLYNAATGETVKKYEGVDEMPAEATQAPEEDTSKAIGACEEFLPNYGTTDATPSDIKIDFVDGSETQMKVSLKWDGVDYEFLYDAETGKATQLKP